jgi:hypothetical protein
MKSERSQADLAKLPVWAADTIRDLTRKLNEARAVIRERDTLGPDAGVIVNPHQVGSMLDESVGFTKDTRVRFRTPNTNWGGIDVYWRGDDLELNATHGVLTVQPRSSNVIWVRAVPT